MSLLDVFQVFPVVVPAGFVPSDSDGDGVDLRWDGKPCPCTDPPHTPRYSHNFLGQRRKGLHLAEDLMAAEGSLLVAPFDGVCPETVRIKMDGRMGDQPGSGTKETAGNYLFLHDVSGRLRVYVSHLRDAPLVQPGQQVKAGDVLGFVGRTGNAVRTYKNKEGKVMRGCPHAHIAVTALTAEALREARRAGITIRGRKLDPVPFLKHVS